jgi:predicted nucleotidyltransferase
MNPRVAIDASQLAAFCQRHHIRKLALFGSVLRDYFRPDSDVDVLVEFDPDARVGLIRLAGMERELSELIGRGVDLREPGELHRLFRQEVLDSAEILYERA